MSNVSNILPKPPQTMAGEPKRWQRMNKWTTDLVQALARTLGVVGADFDAIKRTVVEATGGSLPITVGAAPVTLASAIATLTDVTQLVMVIGNVTLTTDAGDDPVSFSILRGSTLIAGDYLPPVGPGATVSKTLIGIDSSLPVGQYTYNFQATTAGGGGDTSVTAAKIGFLVI